MLFVLINKQINIGNFFKVILSRRNFSENVWKPYVRLITDYQAMFGPSAETLVKDLNLAGKTCLITGASGGIGTEIIRCLNMRDCKVLMACRNMYKASRVAKNACTNIDLVTKYELNLGSLACVKRCADNIIQEQKKIDIVILNAATFGIPWTLTEDRLETIFQVNFLSQYYLLLCIRNILTTDARVVITSSESHRHLKLFSSRLLLDDISLPQHKYTSIKSYNISKFCGILLMHYLSCQWKDSHKSIFCAHPGSFIKTGLCQNWWPYETLYTIMSPFSKSIKQGASTIIYCATSPELAQTRSAYYRNCKCCEESNLATDFRLAFKFHNLISDVLRERVDSFDKLVL